MRKLVVVLGLCGALTVGPEVYAACLFNEVFFHQNTFFACQDAKEVAGFAWQLDSPLTVNTGTEDIICEEAVGNCLAGGVIGDGQVIVQSDWGNSGIVGCPRGAAGTKRVVLAVQCNDGTGIIGSLSGAIGYFVDVIHQNNPDPDTGAFPPIVAGSDAGRPRVLGLSGDQLSLNFPLARVFNDCDAGSAGEAFGSCVDSFVPEVRRGRIFTTVAPCGTRPDLRLASWTLSPVAIAADGTATITVTRPADDRCFYVGATTFVGGGGVAPQESSGITGFVSVGGVLSASPVALGVMAEQAAGNVRVRWRTDLELGLAGFNILAEGKQGSRKVNDALIPARGNGGGTSYEEFIARGRFQGNRTVVIESVMADGSTLRSAPAKF